MNLSELLKSAGYPIKLINNQEAKITSLEILAQKATYGSLYCCIESLNTDRHDRAFAGKAVENGASSLLCSRVPEGIPDDIPILIVDNVRKALCHIAAAFYGHPHLKLKLIGVTGTNGKTSVACFMEHILRAWGKRTAMIGTIGARLDGADLGIEIATSTTPDTIELFQMLAEIVKRGGEWVVMETSSHAFWLNKLEGIRFEAGIFTNLTQDHLNDHGTMEAYGREKAKLFSRSAISIINADDKFFTSLLQSRFISYGLEADGARDYKATEIVYRPDGCDFKVLHSDRKTPFSVLVHGRFSVYNTLSVIACATELGVPTDIIQSALSTMKGVPGRCQAIENNKGIYVFVDYAHTPDGLANIITAVRNFAENRIITVFGCGGDRDAKKRPLMGSVCGELSDYLVITSDNPRNEKPEDILAMIEPAVKLTNCPYFMVADREEAIKHAIENAEPGDAVIIAGKGHENYQEFENKRRIHFDDAEITQKYLW